MLAQESPVKYLEVQVNQPELGVVNQPQLGVVNIVCYKNLYSHTHSYILAQFIFKCAE